MNHCNLFTLALFLGCFLESASCQESRPESLERFRRLPGLSEKEGAGWFLYQQRADIGTVEWMEKYPPPPTLALATAQNFFYTDNAFLTETHRKESLGWNGFFGVAVVPYSTYRWTPQLGFEYFIFRYDRESLRDYDAQIASASSQLALTDDRTWSWTAAYSVWRLHTERANRGEFYKQGELENRLNWQHRLTTQPSLSLHASYGVTWRHATPSVFDRVATDLTLNVTYSPAKYFQLVPFVRPEGRFYTTDTAAIKNRRDFNLFTGLAAAWTPTKYIALVGAVAWVSNYSSVNSLDYEVTEPLIGVFGRITF